MFVLGFYVSLVVQRWWEQYMLLPWPDSFAIKVVGLFQADPEADVMKWYPLHHALLLHRPQDRQSAFA